MGYTSRKLTEAYIERASQIRASNINRADKAQTLERSLKLKNLTSLMYLRSERHFRCTGQSVRNCDRIVRGP